MTTLTARHWWTRARLRWRSRSASAKREFSFGLDVAFTGGVVIAGLVMANTSLDTTSKFALAVLLGTFELVYLFGRSVTRRLRQLSADSLTTLPRDKLSPLLHDHLSFQRSELLDKATQLGEQSDCELSTHDMYRELLGLTEVVTKTRAGFATGSILAISSTNIEDFEDEPLAEAYLEANRDAVEQFVVVQRLFLIDQAQAEDRQVIGLIKKHEQSLVGKDGKPLNQRTSSGVKWLLKSKLSLPDQAQDFALFANEALMTQAPAGQGVELTQDIAKIRRSYEAFVRLWSRKDARTPGDLVQNRRS